MNFDTQDFSFVEKKYLPLAFWSLNDRLTEKESVRLIGEMDRAALGGFFLHARGGLETPYMGDEWFDNINVSSDEAHSRSMYPYAYDENGWPSGFADGLVPALGDKYRLKSLCCSKEDKSPETTVAHINDLYFYLDINPFYSDLLNPDVTDKFIELAYKPYIEKSPSVDGFFTDEPQLSRICGIPWTDNLTDEFEKAYGIDLISHLPELFYDSDNAEEIRIKYWRLITTLFCNNYSKRIYDYCTKHKKTFTGHFLLEEWFMSQITSNGAVMPSYRYFDIPGMDMLTLNKDRGCGTVAPYQVSSVAHQYNKSQVLTESFAACGHGADFDDLMAVFSWQAVRGANLLCLHLSPYSMRGLRKRDYPPAIGPQQPWWKDFDLFCNAVGRIGAFLSEGKTEFDTLVLHPMTSCWAAYSVDGAAKINSVQNAFLGLLSELERKHILFDLGDEVIMAEDATVSNGEIVIGSCRYKRLIVQNDEHLLPETRKLISEFEASGGTVYKDADAIEAYDIVSSPDITYTRRLFDSFTFHYFVNSTGEEKKAFVSRGNKIMDIISGNLSDFDGNLTLPPYGGAVIIENEKRESLPHEEKDKKYLDLSGSWHITSSSPNSLTLDRCSYTLDGEDGEETYVLNVFARALSKKASHAVCSFTFYAEDIPEKIALGIEAPEKFGIRLNGSPVKSAPNGTFFDESVALIDITGLVKVGKNVLTLETDLSQSEEVYEKIKRAEVFEAEKNNLKFDSELESVYLVGNFGVKCQSFSDVSDKLTRTNGFSLCRMPSEITLQSIEQQGFPFFAGSITLEKEITSDDTALYFSAEKKGLSAISLKVNNTKLSDMVFAPYEADISSLLKPGSNRIEIELTSNLRNLLGPHHLPYASENSISPDCFYEEKNPFLYKNAERIKEYNILKTGLF